MAGRGERLEPINIAVIGPGAMECLFAGYLSLSGHKLWLTDRKSVPGGYIVSWSGGKDSCLALYKAIQKGYKVSYILNFISKEFKRVSFHGTEAKLIKLQSEALEIPLLQKETTPDGYEKEFKEAVRGLIPKGIKGIIFGDVYLEEHKKWAERVCNELGIEAVEPLWG